MDTRDWIHGVTIWGSIHGTDLEPLAPDSGLVRANGTARPAMTWLMDRAGTPHAVNREALHAQLSER